MVPNHSTFLVSYTKAIALFVYSGQIIQGFYCPLFIYQTCDLYPFLGNVDVSGFFLFFVWSLYDVTHFINFYSEWSKELAAAAFSSRKPSLGKAVAKFALIELVYVGIFGFLNVSFLTCHIQKQLGKLIK